MKKPTQKIPSEWAYKLATLHNLVMELQEQFEGYKNALDYGEKEDIDDVENLDDFDDASLLEELEEICYKLEDLEADTSELDCNYNDYDY